MDVLLGGEIQDPEAVDDDAGYDARERTLDPRTVLVPLAADLDLRLAVEDLELVAWNGVVLFVSFYFHKMTRKQTNY